LLVHRLLTQLVPVLVELLQVILGDRGVVEDVRDQVTPTFIGRVDTLLMGAEILLEDLKRM
jgi:hypothetical protein